VKTIRQIADELGVTKQAVHKKIRQEPLSTKLRGFMATDDGMIKVDDNGEKLIKSVFSERKPSTATTKKVDAIPDNFTSITNELIASLREELTIKNKQLEAKDTQLEAKDRQIEELTATIRIQAESINADRKNELAGTIIDGQRKLTDGKEKGFFSRLFRRKE